MRRFFVWGAACLTVLGLVFVVLPQSSKQREIRAAHANLERMQPDAAKGDHAGADALWLLFYDMPDPAERRRVMAAQGNQLKHEVPNAQKLPQWPIADSDQQLHCLSGKESCIQTAHAQHALLKEFVQTNRMALQNADALSQYASLEFMPPRHLQDPNPTLGPLFALTAVAAWHWVEDRPQQALAQVCRSMQTGRRLMQANSGLIATMVGSRLMQRNSMMMAEMLAEQPQWAQQLPEPCSAALEPLPSIFERHCSAMRVEFQYIAQGYDDLKAETSQKGLLNKFDVAHSKAMLADALAPACDETTQKNLLQDRLHSPNKEKEEDFSHPTLLDYITRPACWHNLSGCILHDIAMPDYTGYAALLQDTATQQQALRAIVALYQTPATQRSNALPQELAAHSSTENPLHYDASKQAIVFSNYDKRKATETELPFAGNL